LKKGTEVTFWDGLDRVSIAIGALLRNSLQTSFSTSCSKNSWVLESGEIRQQGNVCQLAGNYAGSRISDFCGWLLSFLLIFCDHVLEA
jgi:hypothetical protein